MKRDETDKSKNNGKSKSGKACLRQSGYAVGAAFWHGDPKLKRGATSHALPVCDDGGFIGWVKSKAEAGSSLREG